MASRKPAAGGRKRKGKQVKAKKPEETEDRSEDEQIEEVEDNEEATSESPVAAKKAKKGRPGPASKAKAPAVATDDELNGDNDQEDEEEPAAKKGKRGRPSSAKKTTKKAKGGKKAVQPTSDSEGEEEVKDYEVERILDVHHSRNGDKEFLIKWVGYSKDESTWEPEKNLNCEEKIAAFLSKLDKILDVTSKELRTNRKPVNRYQDKTRNSGVRTSRRGINNARVTYYGQEDE